MVPNSKGKTPERLVAIDFEDCDLGDPMWDLAYLATNLELEQQVSLLEDLNAAHADEKRRARAYIPLAMVHCATCAALHGEMWAQNSKDLMERVKAITFLTESHNTTIEIYGRI